MICKVLLEDGAKLPNFQTPGAAGADVEAFLKEGDITIKPGESGLIPTGLRFEIPSGYEIQVRPRSGLAFRNQITVLNTPGTIDSDYRGELKVILINHGKADFVIKNGDRIAQLVFAPVIQCEYISVDDLDETKRSDKGFGSTGL